jgi:uncharacterized protein YajQ (UPF0234 family)
VIPVDDGVLVKYKRLLDIFKKKVHKLLLTRESFNKNMVMDIVTTATTVGEVMDRDQKLKDLIDLESKKKIDKFDV